MEPPPAYSEEPSSSFLILKLSKKWEEEDHLIDIKTKDMISLLETKTDTSISELKQRTLVAINNINLQNEEAKARLNEVRARQIDRFTSNQICEKRVSWSAWFIDRFLM